MVVIRKEAVAMTNTSFKILKNLCYNRTALKCWPYNTSIYICSTIVTFLPWMQLSQFQQILKWHNQPSADAKYLVVKCLRNQPKQADSVAGKSDFGVAYGSKAALKPPC